MSRRGGEGGISHNSYGLSLASIDVCNAGAARSTCQCHSIGGAGGGGGRTGRAARLEARLGADERMEGSAMHVNMMSSWMAPRASRSRDVRICPDR